MILVYTMFVRVTGGFNVLIILSFCFQSIHDTFLSSQLVSPLDWLHLVIVNLDLAGLACFLVLLWNHWNGKNSKVNDNKLQLPWILAIKAAFLQHDYLLAREQAPRRARVVRSSPGVASCTWQHGCIVTRLCQSWAFGDSCSECSSFLIKGLPSQRLSGTLSPLIRNLSELQSVLLQNNAISGPIPSTIGKLEKLQTLDFSNNTFSGEIPTSFGDLKNLNYLQLNNNSLIGPCPDSLSQIGGLALVKSKVISSNVERRSTKEPDAPLMINVYPSPTNPQGFKKSSQPRFRPRYSGFTAVRVTRDGRNSVRDGRNSARDGRNHGKSEITENATATAI
ncbi:hypothetical protein F3Y22_tig00111745pilonHSYRG00099 [Hibiscus syriacus]|uniref:Uncharacterized protein n=1 Tax=Hibiscus syriacus TaxID=106335 RepID=A0A6A2YEH8_HIBSY|nr:hypothetical protein F3Y22_tig00111745pilonHSYRG00099 [Hibiscus syriacus]